MDKISIGRASECEFNIPETFTKVSNEHADIKLENDVLTFSDHSSNGTIINGQNVHHRPVTIKQGDSIILAGEYQVKWSEIERFFPSLHRATERFDGSQVDTSGRKTEMFDGSQVDNGGRETEMFYSSNDNPNGRKTESMNSNVENGEIRGQLNEFTQAEIEEITEKWNTGAFLSSWVWALANHIYWPLVIIPISLIPYAGQVASLFLCTYLGLNGYKLAWEKSKNRNFKSFVANQKKWLSIGVLLFIVFAAIQALSLYFIL